jgi:Tfp pilus assembly PilM family ATPase
MRGMFGTRLSPIGVFMDSRFVTAAQAQRTSKGWALAAAARLPRASSRAEPDVGEVLWIRAALLRQGFRGRRVALATPEDKLHSAILEMPPRSSGAPLEDIAAAELARIHGYEARQARTVCFDLPASTRFKDGTHVMTLACEHAAAESLLNIFEAAGLDVAVLGTRLYAVGRACQPLLCAAGFTAVLDLGWDSALLCLFYGEEVIYQRFLPDEGVARLAGAIALKTGLEADSVDYVLDRVGLAPRDSESGPQAGAFGAATAVIRSHVKSILEEMKAPLSYAANQYPGVAVENVLVTGFGAAIPGLADHVRGGLEAKVRQVAPRDVMECPPAQAEKGGEPSLMAAIGLARHSG